MVKKLFNELEIVVTLDCNAMFETNWKLVLVQTFGTVNVNSHARHLTHKLKKKLFE